MYQYMSECVRAEHVLVPSCEAAELSELNMYLSALNMYHLSEWSV